MIDITHIETSGWGAALRGMRNPMNSWRRADTVVDGEIKIGPNDLKLAKNLADAGPVHGKFLRMINVSMDILAPLYWWKEFDTYKVGTVANSCSTMHKIAAKEFEVTDFSFEHLINDGWAEAEYYIGARPIAALVYVIEMLNESRNLYLQALANKKEETAKIFWWQMIQLLPTSYNQKRTVQLNYAVLKNIYSYRKDHKLTEWREFCKMIEMLPFAKELIIGEEKEND